MLYLHISYFLYIQIKTSFNTKYQKILLDILAYYLYHNLLNLQY